MVATTCYVAILNAFLLTRTGCRFVYLMDLIFVVVVLRLLVKNFREREFLKTLREFLITLLVVTIVVTITGSALRNIGMVIERRSEVYGVYPALIDTVGDFGSVVASTTTTKLFLELMKPTFSSMRRHVTEILSAWIASVIMFTICAGFACVIYGMATSYQLAFLTELLTTNVLATSIMVFIVHAVAMVTFRHALDPDNFVIPIKSSIGDAVTTIFLFFTLMVLT